MVTMITVQRTVQNPAKYLGPNNIYHYGSIKYRVKIVDIKRKQKWS